MKFWLAGLLLGFVESGLNSSYVCTEETYMDHIFESCLVDTDCTENLNLHHDERQFFDQLLETELLRPMQLGWSRVCSEDGYAVFMALLRTHEFCKPNHIMDIGNSCVCRHDKQCQEKHPSAFRLSELSKAVLILILVVLVVYVGLGLLKAVRKAVHPVVAAAKTPVLKQHNYKDVELEVM